MDTRFIYIILTFVTAICFIFGPGAILALIIDLLIRRKNPFPQYPKIVEIVRFIISLICIAGMAVFMIFLYLFLAIRADEQRYYDNHEHETEELGYYIPDDLLN